MGSQIQSSSSVTKDDGCMLAIPSHVTLNSNKIIDDYNKYGLIFANGTRDKIFSW
jgi:hypothetical protein